MSLDSAPQYFVNADARGGLIDGKQSYTVAQAANQIIRAKNDGFYLLTDSTVERFNNAGEFQWSQPLSARPQALIEGKQIMVLSGNTVQVVTPPEQTASSGQ